MRLERLGFLTPVPHPHPRRVSLAHRRLLFRKMLVEGINEGKCVYLFNKIGIMLGMLVLFF